MLIQNFPKAISQQLRRGKTLLCATLAPVIPTMRKVISTVFLLLAYLLFIGGGFEVSGLGGWPSRWGIGLSLCGQVALFVAGDISRPAKGKMGVFRAVAFTMFVVWSLGVIVVLLRIFYWQTSAATSLELLWAAVQAFSGATFLLISTKRWKLLARYREND